MLIQLVYMSAATRPFDTIDLSVLLGKAREKNERLGVSGMLVFHDNSFLQVLEGSQHSVEQLYQRITQDDRHAQCELLLRTFIDKRSFGDWTMGFVNTKLFGSQALPGFNDFFGKRFSPAAFASNPSTARKLLLAFREGMWRQTVDIGANRVFGSRAPVPPAPLAGGSPAGV